MTEPNEVATTDKRAQNKKLRVLIELRPALDGHAGIPQETRLLFNALLSIPEFEVVGMIQHSGHALSSGLAVRDQSRPHARAIDRLSRVVISLQQTTRNAWIATVMMALRQAFGLRESLTRFDSHHFKDFVWRAMFAKTLHADDFDRVTQAQYRVLQVPWTGMHRYALITKAFGLKRYPKIDTSEFDIFIAETPFPGRISANTKMIVRYHDAIPVLMPHTIADKKYHQASHFNALSQNAADGAWFSCVSDATRNDLLSIFPQVSERAVVVHNMISHHYFVEQSEAKRVPDIIRMRYNDGIKLDVRERPDPSPTNEPMSYLLAVSTIEPRKNHLALLEAWEQLASEGRPDLKLVLVGMLGWDHAGIVKKFKPWIESGRLFVLHDVPSADLRALYRHAACTVCPSFGEGFDFSGVEALRCGGRVVASDIAVHREVYGAGATYFSPYSTSEMRDTIRAVLELPESATGIAREPNVANNDVLRERLRDMILGVVTPRDTNTATSALRTNIERG
jgi:glycosyltransferase involved in cell wall biosynthesis